MYVPFYLLRDSHGIYQVVRSSKHHPHILWQRYPVKPVDLDLTKGPSVCRRANLELFLNHACIRIPSGNSSEYYIMRNYYSAFFLFPPREKRVALSFWFYGLCFGSHIFLFLLWIVKGRGNEGLTFLCSGLFMVRNNGWPRVRRGETDAKFPKTIWWVVIWPVVFLFTTLSYKIRTYKKLYRARIHQIDPRYSFVCTLTRYDTIITVACTGLPFYCIVYSVKKKPNENLVKKYYGNTRDLFN